jgi:hypothetical protein
MIEDFVSLPYNVFFLKLLFESADNGSTVSGEEEN